MFLILTAIRCWNLIGPENFICFPAVGLALDSLHKTRQSNATLLIASKKTAGSRGEEFNENREGKDALADKQGAEDIYWILYPLTLHFHWAQLLYATAYLSITAMAKLKLFPKRVRFCLSSKVTYFVMIRMGISTPISRKRIFQIHSLWFRVLQWLWCSFFRDLILLQSNNTHILTF